MSTVDDERLRQFARRHVRHEGNRSVVTLPAEELQAICDELLQRRQTEALHEQDAKRYRWLRDQCSDVDVREGFGWLGQNGGIDAAIDSAMKGS